MVFRLPIYFRETAIVVWGGMPVEAISRIEVIRGPGSALYGADAFAGVINIVTKHPTKEVKNAIRLACAGRLLLILPEMPGLLHSRRTRRPGLLWAAVEVGKTRWLRCSRSTATPRRLLDLLTGTNCCLQMRRDPLDLSHEKMLILAF